MIISELSQLTCLSLNEDGSGTGFVGNKPVQIWNALPNEILEVEFLKRKKGTLHLLGIKIPTPSPYRIKEIEDHFLSCSPWQIMDFAYENKIKKQILENRLRKDLGYETQDYPLLSEDRCLGYRNKMEFSFTQQDGLFSLAFFRRDGTGKIPLTECRLAEASINTCALHILNNLRKQVPASVCKSLIIRTCAEGQTVAGLFIRDKIRLDAIPLTEALTGFAVYYSDPKSPASVVTETLSSVGSLMLQDKVAGATLSYGLLNFFQVNIPLFETALSNIGPFVEAADVLDLYGGVGIISIALKDKIKSAIIGEIDAAAIECAKTNCAKNNCVEYACIAKPSEHLLDLVNEHRVLILDPPRGGLHPKLIRTILKSLPPRIVYLACNHISQIRDIEPLTAHYKIIHASGYNFFPRTPHIESLLILDKKRPYS